jgi:GGDEF domain-containing protein
MPRSSGGAVQSLRELPAPITSGNPLPLSFSIGVATFPFHAPTSAGLVITASFAMHKAKRTGGNKVCLAEPSTCL